MLLLTQAKSIGRLARPLSRSLYSGLIPLRPWARPFTITSRAAAKLDLPALDLKWRKRWAQLQQAQKDKTKDKVDKYILPMFPYPSGYLHLGHLRVYTIADAIARYNALRGHNVLLPMGWDAFGLPAENAAIERSINPATWTKDNIARMKEQLQMMNGSWDWERVRPILFVTSNP